jgi:DNA-directed RNA polymerase subunit alpha
MLKTKNFGRKSLEDIRKVIREMGLDFGMKLDNFEEQYKKWRERNQQDEA